MIKKLFLCAALVGAVGLTSCVDDVQSAATQAIHNAKAEQLKAMGEAAKANAEAALIQANAQQKAAETGAAAQQAQQELIKAQAAYLNAQAALEQAKADAQKAQTEIDKQKAEVAIQQALAEVEKTKAEVEWTKTLVDQEKAKLQALIAQYEMEIAKYKWQIEQYNNKLADEINTAQGKQYAQLKSLVEDYNTQVTELYRLQGLLTTEIFKRDKYKAGLLTWEDGLREDIKSATEKINALDVKISEFKAQIAIYQTDDYKNAAAEVAKLEQRQAALITEKRNANLAYQEKLDAFQSATKAVNESPYMEAVKEFTNATPTIEYPGDVYFVFVDENGEFEYNVPNASSNPVQVTGAPLAACGNWCVVEVAEDANNDKVYTITPVFTSGKMEKKQLNALVKADGSIQFYYVIETPNSGGTPTYSYKDLEGNSISSKPTATPGKDVEFEYVYYTYDSPYYAIDGDGATKLNSIMSKNAKDAKEAEDKASKLYGDMTAQQTAVAKAWDAYKDAKKANAAITEADDPKKADAEKEELAKAQQLWQVMIDAEKAIVDSEVSLSINGTAISELGAKAPEATDEAAWNAIITQINSVHTKLEKRIDEAVSTTKSAYILAEYTNASAQKNADIVKENLDAMTTGATAFQGLLDKANKANEDDANAVVELGAIDAEAKLVQAMIYAYNQLTADPSLVPIKYEVPVMDNGYIVRWESKDFSKSLNNVANINELVGKINESIEAAQKEIIKLDEDRTEYQEKLDATYLDYNEDENLNELLTKCEDEIQKLTLEVQAQQAIVDAAQAAVEAAIKAITPDAPAEK